MSRKKIAKTIRVTTNDPESRSVELTITGMVVPRVKIEPTPVAIKGAIGQSIVEEVKITPLIGKSLQIEKIYAESGQNISYNLSPVPMDDKTGYLLTVTNTRKTPGRYFDTIFVQLRDEGDIETFSIPVTGLIR